ncbi:hypothetical protein QAD02_003032 [Eretmocerus hayati]|uniref:Uncharacterized protein n=1 Tax=Eretmocerus hayati TaxID=131215 RepID=A0ACC2NLK0_9HYME|nr:hypothetical protein QAD02_003032 [Eretmocerus hayati]
MDEETESLLKQWGFDKFVDKFKAEEIDLEALEALTPQMITSLIPTVGPQSKFIKYHKQYFDKQRENKVSSVKDKAPETSTSNESSLSNPDEITNGGVDKSGSSESTPVNVPSQNNQAPREPRRWNDVDNDVARYLKNDNLNGVPLFVVYEKRAFSKKERSKISSIVIEAELSGDPDGTISPARFKELALQTIAIFPLENAASYSIGATTNADGNRQAPKGCYYNYYVNRGRGLRKDGVRTSIRKSTSFTSQRIPLSGVSNDALIAHERLKKNLPNRPWEEIEADWELTHDIRRDELSQPSASQNKTKKVRFTYAAKQDENSIHAYMKAYLPLLEIDFIKAYLNIPTNALSDRWPQIVSMLQDLYPEEEDFTNDDLRILQLFAELFDPFLMIGKDKTCWRPSKREIVDGFVLHSTSDIEASIKRMRDQLALVKKTMQPIPIIVDGQDGNYICYVQIENIMYIVPSVQKALDLCFKSYHALHAEYPVQSIGPWLLLQKGVYRLHTVWDHDDSRVIELLDYFSPNA